MLNCDGCRLTLRVAVICTSFGSRNDSACFFARFGEEVILEGNFSATRFRAFEVFEGSVRRSTLLQQLLSRELANAGLSLPHPTEIHHIL